MIPMERPPDWQALARYLGAECSEAEEEAILTWAAAHPSNRELLESTRRARAAASTEEAYDIEAAWSRVERRIAASDRARRPRRRAHSLTSAPVRWAVAASLLIVTAVSIYRIPTGIGLGKPEGVAAQELIAGKGERARLRLSDGSQVLLAPDSRIEVPANFGAESRELRLTGEAFFDVVPDPDRPFRVRAGGAVTRVLGTEFNVRAYPDDLRVRVVVAEGEVSLRSEADSSPSAVLHSGDLGELDPRDGAVVTRKADLDAHLGWRQGLLTFDNAPLSEVVREIERWYGVPVRLGNADLSSRRLTGSFRDLPVAEVVAVVAASLGLEYTRVGQTYIIQLKGSTPVLATQ